MGQKIRELEKEKKMIKITLRIEGMACGMCESTINDAVRRAFKVRKVSSSRSKKQTVILTETEIAEDELRKVIGATGYELISIQTETLEEGTNKNRKEQIHAAHGTSGGDPNFIERIIA